MPNVHRIRKQFEGENLYIIVGKNTLYITVPYENRLTNATLRLQMEALCQHAPHRDWQGVEQFKSDCYSICGEESLRLVEIIDLLAEAVVEAYNR